MSANKNFRLQTWIVAGSMLLFVLKFVAYYATNSNAILSDALESIVNVTAGWIGLYSLYIASKPKDKNHPYGHGKIEFISAAIEGTLISLAGVLTIYKSVLDLLEPQNVQNLDWGIFLVAISAVINYLMGTLSVQMGKKNNSLALIASGKHLQSDTYTTVGLILGIAVIYFTKLYFLDSVIAIGFGIFIGVVGYKILRSSIAGIMDETDLQLIKEIVTVLEQNRQENWVDLHCLRLVKYGSMLHFECHLTLPWYLNLLEADREVDALKSVIFENFGKSVDMLVHTDPCLDLSCQICDKECPVRREKFVRKLSWNTQNLTENQNHHLE